MFSSCSSKVFAFAYITVLVTFGTLFFHVLNYERQFINRRFVYQCKALDTFIFFPSKFDPATSKVVFSAPGAERNGKEYMYEGLVDQAEKESIVLVSLNARNRKDYLESTECPESPDRFRFWPRSSAYQFGNVGVQAEREGERNYLINDRPYIQTYNNSLYIFEHIDRIFDTLKVELNLTTDGYYYWGHSAGAQLVLRHVLIGSTRNMIKACVANAGSFLFPTTENIDAYGGSYPYTLSPDAFPLQGQVDQIMESIRLKYSNFKLQISAGEKDVDWAYPPVAQGSTRFGRAQRFFNFVSHDASVNNINLAWKFHREPDVRHTAHQMWPSCWNFFFNTSVETPPFAGSRWPDSSKILNTKYPMVKKLMKNLVYAYVAITLSWIASNLGYFFWYYCSRVHRMLAFMFITRKSHSRSSKVGNKVGTNNQSLGAYLNCRVEFESMLDFLCTSEKDAILSVDNRKALVHRQLKAFVATFGKLLADECPLLRSNRKPRVAVVVENGPELSSLILSLISWFCVVPLAPGITIQEARTAVERTQCDVIIVQSCFTSRFLGQFGCHLVELVPSKDTAGTFQLQRVGESGNTGESNNCTEYYGLNGPSDTALILFTSGTSGTPKLVSYTLNTLVIGAKCIIRSWGLTSKDVCYNCMPLNHIGGISRNLLSVIISKGAVVASPGLDVETFWDIQSSCSITWYYSGPVQHKMILEEGVRRSFTHFGESLPKNNIRMICNAAGSLDPILAERMRHLYACVVLPGYGMTECMPISCPPANYKLEKPGSSGLACGPDIRVVNEENVSVGVGVVGRVMVSGPPCFDGYLDEDTSAFISDENGKEWFDTGDVGYLDHDQFLFITGRKKEIINRGGEVISPFEIETVYSEHPWIANVVAFSTPHQTLVETVGLWIVPKSGDCVPSLLDMQEFAAGKLHSSKWPQVLVVCMKGIPQGSAGKVQRIGISERLAIPEVNENSVPGGCERMFKVETEEERIDIRTTSLSCLPFNLDLSNIVRKINRTLNGYGIEGNIEIKLVWTERETKKHRFHFEEPKGNKPVDIVALISVDEDTIHRLSVDLKQILGRHEIPCLMLSLPESLSSQADDSEPEDAIARLAALSYTTWKSEKNPSCDRENNKQSVYQWLESEWATSLGTQDECKGSSDFFQDGGDSLLAGQLAASVRQKFGIGFRVVDIFKLRVFRDIVKHIEFEIRKETEYELDDSSSVSITNEQTNIGLKSNFALGFSFLQIAWTLLVYPTRRASGWLLFAFLWPYFLETILFDAAIIFETTSRFLSLIVTLLTVRAGMYTVFPLVGILIKWVVVGRYKEGDFTKHSFVYLRWWLVDKALLVCGRGLFDCCNMGRCLYYQFLGASIGANVQISSGSRLTEFDLIHIGSNSVISDDVTISPFVVKDSKVIMKAITVGDQSYVCPKSELVPGSKMPDRTSIGHLSSSYFIKTESKKVEQDKLYCNVLDSTFPGYPWVVFVGYPILAISYVFAAIPTLTILYLMVFDNSQELQDIANFEEVLIWFVHPKRVMFYVAIRVAQTSISPFFYFAFVVFIKKALVGKFKPGPRGRNATCRVRMKQWIMARLLPDGTLGGVAPLLGKHYELISCCYRLLGSSVGERVYWPGSGFFVLEHDLLSIGNDVVFGSRTRIETSTIEEAKSVFIASGANVSDRCVLLPGCSIGTKAVLGTGTFIPEDFDVPNGSTWIGCNYGEPEPLTIPLTKPSVSTAIENIDKGDQSDISPFGRVFHLRETTPYYVLREWQMVLVHILIYSTSSAFKALPLPATLVSVSLLYGGFEKAFQTLNPASEYYDEQYYVLYVYAFFCAFFSLLCAFALLIDIGSKWVIIGKRLPGNYSWDKNSYIQRWQIHLAVQSFRQSIGYGKFGVLDLLGGSVFLNMYYRLLGAKVGKNCVLYPKGAQPRMTEPDLVEIKDNVSINDAVVVSHVNSRGLFVLNRIVLGSGSSLCNGSRVMTGAILAPSTVVHEHSLVFQGESTTEGEQVIGWPTSYQPYNNLI